MTLKYVKNIHATSPYDYGKRKMEVYEIDTVDGITLEYACCNM